MAAAKRSWPRRIGRWLARTLGAVLVLALLALGALHTRWGKAIVRARVEAALGGAVTGHATLGSVDYGFLFDGIDLGDLAITDAEGKPVLSATAIHVDLDRRSLFGDAPVIERVDVTGLRVAIAQTADGRTNLAGLGKPSGRPPLTSLRIAELTLHGGLTFTQRDGTVIELADLALGGSLTARPAAEEVDAELARVSAHVAIRRPGGATTTGELALGTAVLGRRRDGLALDLAQLELGALAIDAVHGRIALVDGRLAGAQDIAITGARVDHTKLATELGRAVFVDDVRLELSVAGPARLLAVHGVVATRGASLAVFGTLDLSAPARPGYQLALVGEGASADLLPAATAPDVPIIRTQVRLAVTGAGVTLADAEADVVADIGATRVGKLAIDHVSARVHASRGAYRVDALAAHGLGVDVGATGEVASDKTVRARVTVSARPAEALAALAAAGIEVPRHVPPLSHLELAVTAAGKLDETLDVTLEPTRVGVAGGSVAVSGSARLEKRVVTTAATRLALRGLSLQQLARLAGRPPPPVAGALSGTVAITRGAAGRLVDFDVALGVVEPGVTLRARGRADDALVTARAELVRTADGAALGAGTARLPIDAQGLVPSRAWQLSLALPRRPLAELVALLPPALRRVLPPGDAELRVELAGTPRAPRGTIDLDASAALPDLPELSPARAQIHATLAPAAAGGLGLAATGTVTAAGAPPLATLTADVALPALFVGRHLDAPRVRAGLRVTARAEIAERAIADLPRVPPLVAALGGAVGGHLEVHGAPAELQLGGELAWRGYRTAAGGQGALTLTVAGTPRALTASLAVTGGLAVTADIARAAQRTDIVARVRAADAPLRPLLPDLPLFASAAVRDAELGTVRADLDAKLALVGGALADVAVTGGLALHGGALALPHTQRRWHDIGLEVAGDPAGVRLVALDVHETDVGDADRRLHASGRLTLAALRPATVELALAAHDWLVLGARSPLLSDAPAATVDLDARISADLRAPVIAVDATVDHLDLRAPDRHDRAHQPETASVAGDLVVVESPAAIGRLPVPAPPGKLALARPLDVRVHIPGPIHAQKAPLDVTARGELTATLRDGVLVPSGEVELLGGTLFTFGRVHDLVTGRVRFDAAHPHGDLALRFVRRLPARENRELAGAERGVQITLTGDPGKPVVAIAGVANASLFDVFAMTYAGRPQYVAPPGLPASSTVAVPRGDQLNVLAYLSLVIPHLLVLDEAGAWADAREPRGAYGRIRNAVLERDLAGGSARVRVVGRPTQPGRSTAEVQWDHLWLHDDHAAFGAGLRGGDRLGGGVGLFFEWSSRN